MGAKITPETNSAAKNCLSVFITLGVKKYEIQETRASYKEDVNVQVNFQKSVVWYVLYSALTGIPPL
ncbi:hypothetical protein COV82_00785 [Candidatus Peregrinibacteria bacterium CG11_big_fil_rev_8_21_14_0_20_46_8]|nr:MAG: hypothetical protein COV82_00785 [Candidatus Peregrinibacteria bacterium CG11_big_fil_rev_8_21_14_0_20_46_8]